MTTRRDFLKVLGAALGVAVVPAAVAHAAELCRNDGDVADLIDKVLGKREAYAVESTVHLGFGQAGGLEGTGIWRIEWDPKRVYGWFPSDGRPDEIVVVQKVVG